MAFPSFADKAFDVGRAQFSLREVGYCVIPDVLSPDDISVLKDRLLEQAAGEVARGVETRDGGQNSPNQRVWNLINKGKVFRDLMTHSVIDAVMSPLLGPDFLLSSFTANIARTGGEPMTMHTDQQYVGFWTPEPVVANIAWMLDDFSDANGGTRLMPGSHLDKKPPGRWDSIAGEGKAGSILVFEGRLWHGTGANTTSIPRHALLSYHCRPFVRQQENFMLSIDPAVIEVERPALLNRLGYKPWFGLGRVEHPRPSTPLFMNTGMIGPLTRDGTVATALL